jgi:DNA-binding LacI/PurR family transcriptional regulator
MQLEISKNRYNGYKDAILKAGLKVDESLVVECDNRAAAEDMTPRILEREIIPDGFFAVNDDTAIGILYTAKRMGYRVPQDISICGFTNGERAIACDPMLTTVEQRGVKVGQESADILIDKVEGIAVMDKVEKRVVRTRLVVRGTTR